MGCCKGDDEVALETASPEDKKAAEAKMAENDKYVPSGAARVPGSIPTIRVRFRVHAWCSITCTWLPGARLHGGPW